MPPIYDSHPLAPFDYIDLDLIAVWDNYTTAKLVAIPFGADVFEIEQHPNIQSRIFTAVMAITQSSELGVSAPKQSADAKKQKRVPTSFLIYNLTRQQRQTLQQCSVWSSHAITFRITALAPHCPNLLFTLRNFAIMKPEPVRQLILETWQSAETQTFLDMIIAAAPPNETNNTKQSLRIFISSLTVTLLEYRDNSGGIKPHFNIYADSSQISDFNVWTQLRTFLAERNYATSMLGTGITRAGMFDCGICHSSDHPRGLCPFPDIPGWNGPSHRPEPSQMRGNRAGRGQRNRGWR